MARYITEFTQSLEEKFPHLALFLDPEEGLIVDSKPRGYYEK